MLLDIKQYKDWLIRYAEQNQLTPEQAAEKLIADALLEDHDAQENEANHETFKRVIRGSLNELNVKQLRLVWELICQLQGK